MLSSRRGSSRVACRMQWSLPRGVQSGPTVKGTSPLALNTVVDAQQPEWQPLDLLRPPRQTGSETDGVLGIGESRRQLAVADLAVDRVEVADQDEGLPGRQERIDDLPEGSDGLVADRRVIRRQPESAGHEHAPVRMRDDHGDRPVDLGCHASPRGSAGRSRTSSRPRWATS